MTRRLLVLIAPLVLALSACTLQPESPPPLPRLCLYFDPDTASFVEKPCPKETQT